MQAKSVKTYASPETDPRLLKIWRDCWEKNGWACRTLTHWDARRHRKYKEGLDEQAVKWMAFAAAGGGLLVEPDTLCSPEAEMPRCDQRDLVCLSKWEYGGANWATQKGADKRAEHLSEGYVIAADGVAELCVEAGSMDWRSAPFVHFPERACRKHKRDQLGWMGEFSSQAEVFQKTC